MLSSSTYLDKMSTKVSQNLSLRLSPERKYGPKYCACTNCLCYPCKCCTLCHHFPCCCLSHSCCLCTICHCCPCRCCHVCECCPCRCCNICHCCPCVCCPTCHCNPCLCCNDCHSFPCKCCSICHSTPCKCCPTCHLYPCRCCSECHSMPCKCCLNCHHTPCTCCVKCHSSPCVCAQNQNTRSSLRAESPVRCCSPVRICHSPCCHCCCSPCCHIICCSPCVLKFKSPNRSTLMGSTGASLNSRTDNRNLNKGMNANNGSYEESQFWDFLRLLMQTESQIEDAKIKLALGEDFNCEDAFRMFELDGRGFLTCEDLKYGLSLLGICATDCDVRLLMKRFDLQKCGTINYADFFDILVPFEKEYRNMVEFRAPNSCCPCRCPDCFSPRTINALKDLFNLIINSENSINTARKNLGTLRLKLRDVFNKIGFGLDYFTNSNLCDYIKRNGLFSSTKDTDLLFIRLDKNRNGKIDYKEVEDEVTPLY